MDDEKCSYTGVVLNLVQIRSYGLLFLTFFIIVFVALILVSLLKKQIKNDNKKLDKRQAKIIFCITYLLASIYYIYHFIMEYTGSFYFNAKEILIYISVIMFFFFRSKFDNWSLKRMLIIILLSTLVFFLLFGNIWKIWTTFLYAITAYVFTFFVCLFFYNKWLKPFNAVILSFWSICALSYLYEIPIAIYQLIHVSPQGWFYYLFAYSCGIFIFIVLLEVLYFLKNWNKKEILLCLFGLGFLAFEWNIALIYSPYSFIIGFSRWIAGIFFITLSIKLGKKIKRN